MKNCKFIGTVEGEDEYALKIVQNLIEAFNYFNRIQSYSPALNWAHRFNHNNRLFEVTISDSLSFFGYGTNLSDHSSTYSYCRIREKRSNEDVRFEILFEFQKNPRRLVRLFYISHSNIRREYRNYYIGSLQSKFMAISLN